MRPLAGGGAGGVGQATVVGRQTAFTERFAGQRITTSPYSLLEPVVQWCLLTATSALSAC